MKHFCKETGTSTLDDGGSLDAVFHTPPPIPVGFQKFQKFRKLWWDLGFWWNCCYCNKVAVDCCCLLLIDITVSDLLLLLLIYKRVYITHEQRHLTEEV